jgi:RNA polymerase sigma factor (sigma-70 family)
VVAGDRHLAQDVAQTVFADLARKAWGLPRDVVLGGWLYRHACFTASKMVRTERRREARERTAMEMTAIHDHAEAGWERVAPFLDAALNGLSAPDRDAIVLRFFQRQDFRAVGSALGVTEDAAQKRVSRALEKLRVCLKRRGATLTAATLATALATEAVATAPAGLASSVAAASLAAAAGTGTSISLTLMKLMAMTKLKAGIAGALVIAGVAIPLARQHQSLNQLRHENLALWTEAGDMDRLRDENKRLAKLQVAADELERLRKENTELLRLRGQVAVLRGFKEDLAKLQAAKPPPPALPSLGASAFIPAEKLADAGLATPEAAAQTLIWAAVNQNKDRLKQVVDVEKFNEAMHEMRRKLDPSFKPGESHEDNFSLDSFSSEGQSLQGFQILSQKFNSPDEAELEIAGSGGDGSTNTDRLSFHRIGEEWKVDLLAAAAHPESLHFTETMTEPDGSEKTNIIKLKIEDQKVRKFVPVAESLANP